MNTEWWAVTARRHFETTPRILADKYPDQAAAQEECDRLTRTERGWTFGTCGYVEHPIRPPEPPPKPTLPPPRRRGKRKA